MSVIRNQKRDRNFTIIDNGAIQDKRLSLKARGLHHLLLSYPKNWEFNTEHLISVNLEGRDSILGGLSELEKFGYIKRSRQRDERGKIRWVRDVYETPSPSTENPVMADREDDPVAGKPQPGFPYTANPSTENPVLYKEYIEQDPIEQYEENNITGSTANAVLASQQASLFDQPTSPPVDQEAVGYEIEPPGIQTPPVPLPPPTDAPAKKPRSTRKPQNNPAHHPDEFVAAWGAYREWAVRHQMNPGDRAAAAEKWDRLFSVKHHLLDGIPTLEEVERGTRLYLAKIDEDRLKNGWAPNCVWFCRMLWGKTDHPTPYWKQALDDEEFSKNLKAVPNSERVKIVDAMASIYEGDGPKEAAPPPPETPEQIAERQAYMDKVRADNRRRIQEARESKLNLPTAAASQ